MKRIIITSLIISVLLVIPISFLIFYYIGPPFQLRVTSEKMKSNAFIMENVRTIECLVNQDLQIGSFKYRFRSIAIGFIIINFISSFLGCIILGYCQLKLFKKGSATA